MSRPSCCRSPAKLSLSLLRLLHDLACFYRESPACGSDLDYSTDLSVETSGKVHLQRFNLLMDARLTNTEFLRCFRDTGVSCDSYKNLELMKRHTAFCKLLPECRTESNDNQN